MPPGVSARRSSAWRPLGGDATEVCVHVTARRQELYAIGGEKSFDSFVQVGQLPLQNSAHVSWLDQKRLRPPVGDPVLPDQNWSSSRHTTSSRTILIEQFLSHEALIIANRAQFSPAIGACTRINELQCASLSRGSRQSVTTLTQPTSSCSPLRNGMTTRSYPVLVQQVLLHERSFLPLLARALGISIQSSRRRRWPVV